MCGVLTIDLCARSVVLGSNDKSKPHLEAVASGGALAMTRHEAPCWFCALLEILMAALMLLASSFMSRPVAGAAEILGQQSVCDILTMN